MRRRTTSTVGHAAGDEYYSGLEESDGNRSDSSEGSGSGLDLGEDDIPVTGFAVASNKRNADFHELFPGIPEGDYLIDDYGCALQKEILVQGRIYVSENHICFRANILGWVTDVSIAISEITTLEKRVTAFVIPNAIRVKTLRAEYTFASFLSRDTTFDVIHNIWRLARPGLGSGALGGNVETEDTIISIAGGLSGQETLHKATACACGKEGRHFTDTALNIVIPGTPERVYNLMFASDFMKDFMAINQKLTDIQVSDWAPTTTGSKLLARDLSYIKPLYGSFGPKQTKCESRDETLHLDFEEYISIVTTTRTPAVPSGGVFSVKTRTCITWASPLSTKVVVTTQIDWTGRSLIKGIIESSAIDGQLKYHKDLDKAMRAYIQEHRSEFIPEDVDTAQVLAEITAEATPVTSEAVTEKERQKERGQRGFLLDMIHDGWEHSTSTTIPYFVIAMLILTNLWTYMHMRPVDKDRLKAQEIAKDKLAGVVTALWDDLAAGKLAVERPAAEPLPSSPVAGVFPSAESLKFELGSLHTTLGTLQATLRAIEERVRIVEGRLEEVQPQSMNQMD
ncbi:GRAM-domain-containing protein [Mycena alexandri]|uniref:GRAM-domain-containing protein n=1 Tax=Mycena alexandri TaxID=1745969 RepID=A0AAD6SSI7_9AGAR|nr:GRAM-domain-containing protein [Mycena alexandri]